MNRATFAGGCFWCTEAIFKRLNGVVKVTPGYSGGDSSRTTYEEISTGATGHAEAIDIEYDESIISFETLLEIFFATHDPTTLNRQGNDVGTQYRSVIFYHNEDQRIASADYIKKLESESAYKDKITTSLEPFTEFFQAEDYHLDYYEKNKSAPYCQVIINPKIKKLIANHSSNLKPEYQSDSNQT